MGLAAIRVRRGHCFHHGGQGPHSRCLSPADQEGRDQLLQIPARPELDLVEIAAGLALRLGKLVEILRRANRDPKSSFSNGMASVVIVDKQQGFLLRSS